jgi:transcription elongation factor Elf1
MILFSTEVARQKDFDGYMEYMAKNMCPRCNGRMIGAATSKPSSYPNFLTCILCGFTMMDDKTIQDHIDSFKAGVPQTELSPEQKIRLRKEVSELEEIISQCKEKQREILLGE